jgi:hypothetical protein
LFLAIDFFDLPNGGSARDNGISTHGVAAYSPSRRANSTGSLKKKRRGMNRGALP